MKSSRRAPLLDDIVCSKYSAIHPDQALGRQTSVRYPVRPCKSYPLNGILTVFISASCSRTFSRPLRNAESPEKTARTLHHEAAVAFMRLHLHRTAAFL